MSARQIEKRLVSLYKRSKSPASLYFRNIERERGISLASPSFFRSYSTRNNAKSARQPRVWIKGTLLLSLGAVVGWYTYECNEIYLGNKRRPSSDTASDMLESWKATQSGGAFSQKSLGELLNSYVVFKLCQLEFLVKAAPQLIRVCETVGLGGVVEWGLRHTFFRHFCGGEEASDVVPTMHQLKAGGVGSIVDLSVESDIAASSSSDDSQDLVSSTNYQIECAKSFTALLKGSVDIAAETPGSYVAVKVTGVVPPLLLKKMTDSLILLRDAYHSVASRLSLTSGNPVTSLGIREFTQMLERLPGHSLLSEETATALFRAADKDFDGKVDWSDVANVFSFRNPMARQVFAEGPIPVHGDKTDVVYMFTASEWLLLDAAREQLFDLCRHAASKSVKIMIDAEQSYFQAAIDDFACDLQEAFNASTEPIVYNTYQLYLRDAYYRLISDYTRAHRNGHGFGVKIVRGAYMVAERERSLQYGYPDPIHKNIASTHASYHRAIDFCMDRLRETFQTPVGSLEKSYLAFQLADSNLGADEGSDKDTSSFPVMDKALSSVEFYKLYLPKTHFDKALLKSAPVPFGVVIASHNKGSILYAAEKMRLLAIPNGFSNVAFAQLMGMQDSVTFSMAANGYNLYKYLPYGPVKKVIPYLLRRAQENSSVLSGAKSDIDALTYEIRSRILPSQPYLQSSLFFGPVFRLLNGVSRKPPPSVKSM